MYLKVFIIFGRHTVPFGRKLNEMIKNLRTLTSSKKSFLLASCLLISGFAQAQTITLFRLSTIVLPRFSTLKDAVAAAQPGDSLVMSADTFRENSITINKNLKLTGTIGTGSRTVLDAESKGRALLINSGNVSLLNLAIANGKIVNDAGGGICNYGSGTLTLSGTSGVNNSRSEGIYAYGGGIYSLGKVVITDNSYVINCYAEEVGGGVYAYSTFVLSGYGVIAANTCNGSGGGVFSRANGGATVTDYAKIDNNTAKEAGGGIFGPCTIARYASIINNKAESGGGITAFGDAVFLKDSCQVSGNTVTNSGGGIWLNNANLYATGYFEIMNNKVITTPGAMNFGGAIYNVNGQMNLNGGNIIGNVSPVATIYTAANTKNDLFLTACYIYNPLPSGKRVVEVMTSNTTPLPAGVYNTLTSDTCWWGKSATGAFTSGFPTFMSLTDITMNWNVNDGLPIDPTAVSFKIEAHFKTGSTVNMDPKYFRRLRANYYASNGSFTDPNPYIKVNTNFITSTYKAPPVADSVVIKAWVDGDTLNLGKIAVPANLSVIQPDQASSIRIYPNPADDVLFISDARDGSALTIFSIEGRLVHQQTINSKTEQVRLNNIPAGAYILQLTDESGKRVAARILKK